MQNCILCERNEEKTVKINQIQGNVGNTRSVEFPTFPINFLNWMKVQEKQTKIPRICDFIY